MRLSRTALILCALALAAPAAGCSSDMNKNGGVNSNAAASASPAASPAANANNANNANSANANRP